MHQLKLIKKIILLLIILIFTNTCNANNNRPLTIVISIKPFYNLVAAVTHQLGTLHLLVPGNTSPHYYTLKPSKLQILNQADIIFWGGKNIEPSLAKIIKNYQKNTAITIIDLSKLPKLEYKPIRNQALTNISEHSPQHAHHDFDPHIWLSINNAKIIVSNIANILSNLDPKNANQYNINALKFKDKLQHLDQQLMTKLNPIKTKPYLVLHDAYQYFETHYNLNPLGALTIHPEISPSIKHLHHIQQTIAKKQLICIFNEPQFEPAYLQTLVANTAIKSGILDPIGQDQDLGEDGYLLLLETLATNLLNCLQ